MANVNRPFGLRPVRYFNGAPYNGANNHYHVPASNPVALFMGDPMILTGTANLANYRGYPPGTLPDVMLTVAPAANIPPVSYVNFIIGSLVTRLPETRESNIYVPASVEAIVMVDEDPAIVYEIQDNGAATLGAAVVGSNANLIAGAGSTASGQSGWMLDAGTINAPSTAALQVTILRASLRIDSDATSPYAIWEVLINQSPYGGAAIGV